jgi:hypothetical protein
MEFSVLGANPRRLAMSIRFSPGFFSTSSAIVKRSCREIKAILSFWYLVQQASENLGSTKKAIYMRTAH